jgi:hypothetical protein
MAILPLYNEAAVEAGNDVDAISWNPTGGSGWKMTAPAAAGDVTWTNNTLKTRAPRITVHDVAFPRVDDEGDSRDTSAAALEIDFGVLDRL